MKRIQICMLTLTIAFGMASVAVAQDDMYFTKKTMKANADNPTVVRPRGYTYSDNQSAYVPTINSEADSSADDVIYLDNDTTMGINMDVDANNRRGRSYSDESYVDSMVHDTVYVTRRIEFIDNGWYDPWCWRSWWYDPWYYDSWYDPWYHGGYWAWHHWYGPGWYDPWYGPGWYRPWYGPGHIVAYSRPNSRNHSNIGRVYADRSSRNNSFSREGSSRRGFSNSNTTFGRNNTNNNSFGNTRSNFGNTRSNFGSSGGGFSGGSRGGGSFGGGSRGGGFGGGGRR